VTTLVDVEGHLFAPPEYELVLLEPWLSDRAALARAYERHRPYPTALLDEVTGSRPRRLDANAIVPTRGAATSKTIAVLSPTGGVLVADRVRETCGRSRLRRERAQPGWRGACRERLIGFDSRGSIP
jgi:hypothetical protein